MGAANDLQESRRVASPLFGWGIGREGGRKHSTHSAEEEERNLLMMAAKEGRREGSSFLSIVWERSTDHLRERGDHRREGGGSST